LRLLENCFRVERFTANALPRFADNSCRRLLLRLMSVNSANPVKSTLAITSVQPLSLPLSEKWRIPKSHIKLGIGLTVLLAGAYGILSEQNFVSSSSAIVSAYVVAVRTPINGIVQNLPASANLHVRDAQSLGYVENPRVDQQHLENLRIVEGRARSEADAMSTEQAALKQERCELLNRTHAHAKAVANRIQLNILQNERLLFARQAAEKQAAIDLDHAFRTSAPTMATLAIL